MSMQAQQRLLEPSMWCRLLAEYMEAANPGALAEAVEMLAGPALLRMVHTRHGAYAACAVMSYGSPKDRKKAIKAMKGVCSFASFASCIVRLKVPTACHVGIYPSRLCYMLSTAEGM